MYSSTGILRYSQNPYKLVVEADQGIADFYRSLIPFKTNKPLYPAHISVVRKEEPVNVDLWGKHEGVEINFYYSGEIIFGQVYVWLNVFCTTLEGVRVELVLPSVSKYTKPPEGFFDCFHLTVANFKGFENEEIRK